jgi:hypothetical protein
VTYRSLTAAVGVAVVLAGLAGLAGFVLPGLNASFVFVALVGGLAGIQGLRYVLARRHAEAVATETGEPERRLAVPAPGDDLIPSGSAASRRRTRTDSRERRVERRRARSRSEGWPRPRPRPLHRRIRQAVIETVRLREHCSTARATNLVATGAWTDDPVAARFLGADVAIPFSTRLRLRFSRRNAYRYRVARTLDALDALRGEDETVPTDTETVESEPVGEHERGSGGAGVSLDRPGDRR